MGIFTNPLRYVWSNLPGVSPSPMLSQEDEKMYAAEKLDNFRWLATLFSTRGNHTLTENDLIAEHVRSKIAEIGQFSEVVYSDIPLEFLIHNHSTLSQANFPLEGFNALDPKGCVLVSSCPVPNATQRAHIFYRPALKQLIVAIPGTASLQQALTNLRFITVNHGSQRGAVHSGFWSAYSKLKDELMESIQDAITQHGPEELILTGHSLGGSLCYLLLIDLFSERDSLLRGLKKLHITVFGAPRTGDVRLVDYFHELVGQSERKYGPNFFQEYSVKGYNDGVPAVPPIALGYRHFSTNPLYTIGGRLYQISAEDSEHAVFTLEYNNNDGGVQIFPRGGHNYYNSDLERFRRRVDWLAQANTGRSGWENRYERLAGA